MNHNLCIDLGNTFAKAGLFRGEKLIETHWKLSYNELLAYVKTINPTNIIVCSVSKSESELQETLGAFASTIYCLTPHLPLPITNGYQTPQTLGTDRLAAAVGAKVLFPDDACLVIDMGTCITYDMVTAQHHFLGGIISVGVRMRFRAMNTFTKRLPLLEPSGNFVLLGKNTQEAIQSGVMNGLLAEIEGIREQYTNQFPDFRVVLCGGDAHFFETRLKPTIFVVPELVLIGLNRILQHNATLQNHV